MADDLDPAAVDPTLTEAGANAAWPCSVCGVRRDEHADQAAQSSHPALDLTGHAFVAARAGEALCYCGKRRDEPSRGCVYHQARAAQRGAEAVDREALAETIRGVLSRCALDGVDPARELADVVVASLARAARGDAPVRSVSAEQVRAEAERMAAQVYPEDYHVHMRRCYADAYERGVLAALGREVTP